jgi:hypothetical protein
MVSHLGNLPMVTYSVTFPCIVNTRAVAVDEELVVHVKEALQKVKKRKPGKTWKDGVGKPIKKIKK